MFFETCFNFILLLLYVFHDYAHIVLHYNELNWICSVVKKKKKININKNEKPCIVICQSFHTRPWKLWEEEVFSYEVRRFKAFLIPIVYTIFVKNISARPFGMHV